MSRVTFWSVLVFGLAVVAGSLSPWNPTSHAAQKAPAAKKQDPKKAPPKTPPAKKVDPKSPPAKKADPKASPPPKKVDPKAAELGPPSPLDLVRGLRDAGMSDLALEYLDELGKQPLPQEVKDLIPLERAKCLLEAADNEPDEGTRLSLVGEAKDGFSSFLKAAGANHPQAAEAYLALARLTSLEAKAQLAKARRIDVPAEEGPARDSAVQEQRAAAAAARPLFEEAAKQFQAAATRIDAQLQQPNLDPTLRRTLARAKFDARLADGINQMALGDTYLHATAAEKKERSDRIEKARQQFAALADDEQTPPAIAWVARAWMAECEYEKENFKVGEEEFAKILDAGGQAVDEGKRMVRFFQLRRQLVPALSGSASDLQALESAAKDWLRRYGSSRQGQSEAVAVKWYLGLALQTQGDRLVPPPPKVPPGTPPPPQTVPATARQYYAAAERLYRAISQTDNEYSDRATKQRFIVVRRLLGEADRPPAEYTTFEESQMASLIQISKLIEEEKAAGPDEAAQKALDARRNAIVALLERARGLATEKDNPADVTEVLIRLIYFYQASGQPYRAAVLGESVARSGRAPGGKAAVAGALAIDGYAAATAQIPVTAAERVEAARRSDRDRAVRLARYLDQRFPNDTATDRARHRLASLLYEDSKPVEAYDALLKVRAGYEQIATVRLFQGALASQLLSAKDSPLADDRKREVFRRSVADLDRVARPPAGAPAEDVKTYITARCRLAFLHLLQHRVDPEGEKTERGFARAKQIATEAVGVVPAFTTLVDEDAGKKTPNLHGWELKLLAEDARTRAVILEGQALFVEGKYEPAYAVVGQVLAEMQQTGPYVEAVKQLGGSPPAGGPEPTPKAAPAAKKGPAPKKAPEPKKGPAPKKAPEPKSPPPAGGDTPPPGADDPELTGRVTKLAEGVDQLRRNLIVLALKIRVKQGQAEQAAGHLDLLKRFGGSVEENVATLQQLTNELAGQILSLRREGKPDEAKTLTDGFAKLLDRMSAEPNLPPSVLLFLGHSLNLVGEHGKAEKMLASVAPPADPGVLTKRSAEIPDEAVRTQATLYRRATLERIRGLRQAKQYDAADTLLKAAMGSSEQQGWAFTSLEFRKEMAYLAEARGTAEPNPQVANKHWGEAVREWTIQVNLFRNQLRKEPKTADGQVDNAAVLRTKNAYFEAYFEYNRCIVRANMQLRKGNPKLQGTFDDVGKKFADMERAAGEDMIPEVREKYADFLAEVPELRKAYEAAGGKMFLRPAAAPGGGGM